MKYVRKDVSPEVAMRLLQGNTRNRHVRRNVVANYSAAMRKGLWETDNPQGCAITIGNNGVLKDGQHRLLAVIDSGVTIPMLIYRVDDSVSIFDEHSRRTTANYLQIGGIDSYLASADVSAAVRLLMSRGSRSAYDTLSNPEVMDYIAENAELLVKARKATFLGATGPVCKKAFIMAAIIEAIRAGEDEAKVKRFAEVVNSGFTQSDAESSAIVFRNELLVSHAYGRTKSAMWGNCGIVQEYIRMFCTGKSRRNKVKEPTFYYTKINDLKEAANDKKNEIRKP